MRLEGPSTPSIGAGSGLSRSGGDLGGQGLAGDKDKGDCSVSSWAHFPAGELGERPGLGGLQGQPPAWQHPGSLCGLPGGLEGQRQHVEMHSHSDTWLGWGAGAQCHPYACGRTFKTKRQDSLKREVIFKGIIKLSKVKTSFHSENELHSRTW